MARPTPRSGNPALRASTQQSGSRGLDVAAIIISVVALLLSGVSAWGQWEQVRVDRDAISEKLSVRAAVKAYDIAKRTYGDSLKKGDRAPTPRADQTRLYVIAHVTNIGKGSGLVADAGVRAGEGASLSFSSLSCENPDPDATSTITCPLPITLASGATQKTYLMIDAARVDSLACSGQDKTITVYFVDSGGNQVSADTGVRVPEPVKPCGEPAN
ncbi:MAG: hypothetical protein J0J11_05565 [Microbacterium sp.]|nr:hypothetical protein [Microbacterium sp.]